jgi:uncharacterized protein
MSNHEASRQLVVKLFESLAACDINAAMDMLTDDCVWIIPGKPSVLPFSGPKNKQETTALFKALLVDAMPDGIKLTANEFTCEGDRVAVEAVSIGHLANGRVYQNQYHFLFKIRDGKFCKVSEYNDTFHVKETFIDP